MLRNTHALNKKLFLFSLPMIGSLLTQQLYNVADMIIVGQFIGVAELAAVGNAGTVLLLFIVISGGIELAVEIIFSRYIGKNDQYRLAKGTTNILVFGALLGVLLAAAGFFLLPLLFKMMNVPEQLLQLTKIYCHIYLLGVPFIYIYDISRAMITSLGDAKKSFYLVLTSSLLNVVLNLLFILVFHMGIAGAALGTILSQGITMCISLMILYHKSKSNPYFQLSVSFDSIQLKEISRIAVPSIFQQFVITLSSVFLQAFANRFGNDVIIGFIAVTKVLAVSRIVISGFSQTLSIFSAQMFAGKKYTDLKQTYRFLTQASLLYAAFVSLVFLVFSEQLCNFFFNSQQHPEGYLFFRSYLIFSIGTLFMTVFKFMNESILRSALRMKEYLLCNIGDLLVKVGSTYLLLTLASSDAFWIGEGLGRLLAFGLSAYFVLQIKRTISLSIKEPPSI
ncbi:MATE family efflux transporter [Enterococcus sp. BWM-S5]|uniref:Probable multidrug resistance protein NorM n=1 Tax=Enterococcus larvae TaxID=2794352 RepID=A0ABS4CHJ6_9ENTE|nr:MATE family efflux transporter [Enterococcus larvae]MBP1046096.1 MATE family efflux transporter [Enterococcus larvae]